MRLPHPASRRSPGSAMRPVRAPKLRGVLVLALAWFALGCGDDTAAESEPLEIVEGCNPLSAEADCLLPFPSDFFRPTGRVELPEVAQVAPFGKPADLYALHRPDGFSVGTPLLALLTGAVDEAQLSFWTSDGQASLAADSPTVLLDAVTGERILHFAEIDPRSEDPARKALIIRPLDRLVGGRRYIVAIRGLQTPEGEALEPSHGFRSLRDEGGKAHPALAALSARYESEVFTPLEAAGIPRGNLLLAWDFTTRTDGSAMGDMLAIREDLLAKVASAPPPITVKSVEDDVSPTIARRIELEMEVPLYVDAPGAGAVLSTSPPVASGTATVPFTVWIPPSVFNRDPGAPRARLLQFGHGFFGDRYECDDFPSEFAEEEGFVVVAADWWGMSAPDRGTVIEALTTDPANLGLFTDRVHQGMANFLALAEVSRGALASLPELTIQGEPAYDPGAIYFYGISMGHILGGTYVALSPSIERAAFSVGGANFSLMMFRASPFATFLALIELGLPDRLDQQKIAVMVQSTFDRIDPLSYAPHVLANPLPGGPSDRRVLQHTGLADSSVPNLASFLYARALGLPVLSEAVAQAPLGLASAASPIAGSALTIFDFGYEPEVLATLPLVSTDVHDSVRRLAASKQQISAFFSANGVITQTCSGVCDPE